MGYATSGLKLVKSGINTGPALWQYISADAHATVEGASYFSDAKQRGLKLRDMIIVINTANDECTLHQVKSVSGNAATVNAATLA